MSSLELLIVASRFWPHAGLTEQALLELAIQIQAAGHKVTVATLRWSRDWSESIQVGGLSVSRFSRPMGGPWSSIRYARSLSRLVTTRHFHGIIASGMGELAAAAFRTADQYTPVIQFIDESYEGVSVNLHRRHVETCQAADAVVANGEAVAQRLAAVSGMPAVAVIEPGISPIARMLPDLRNSIRAAFSKVHGVLRIDPQQPLVVTASRMNDDQQIVDLVQAWKWIHQQLPTARLWCLGDGRQAGRIWQAIVHHDLCHTILMPGYFDDIHDIMVAADLYVHVGGPTQSGDGLWRALLAGLPAVSIDLPLIRARVRHLPDGLLVPAGQPKALAQSILHALSNTDGLRSCCQQTREFLAPQFSVPRQVDKWVQLVTHSAGKMIESVT